MLKTYFVLREGDWHFLGAKHEQVSLLPDEHAPIMPWETLFLAACRAHRLVDDYARQRMLQAAPATVRQQAQYCSIDAINARCPRRKDAHALESDCAARGRRPPIIDSGRRRISRFPSKHLLSFTILGQPFSIDKRTFFYSRRRRRKMTYDSRATSVNIARFSWPTASPVARRWRRFGRAEASIDISAQAIEFRQVTADTPAFTTLKRVAPPIFFSSFDIISARPRQGLPVTAASPRRSMSHFFRISFCISLPSPKSHMMMVVTLFALYKMAIITTTAFYIVER